MEMDFNGARAELEDGIIFLMTGGSEQHSRVAGNILAFLRQKLRGSGCRPYGADVAAQTGEATVRLPDVTVHCGNPTAPENRTKKLIGDPTVIVEVLSPSTERLDQKTKLEEYRSLEGSRDILLVDPRTERVRHARRNEAGEWIDGWLPHGADVQIDSLSLVLPHTEIFADD